MRIQFNQVNCKALRLLNTFTPCPLLLLFIGVDGLVWLSSFEDEIQYTVIQLSPQVFAFFNFWTQTNDKLFGKVHVHDQ